MMFSGSTTAGFLIAGALCILLPAAAVVIYKLKNKDAPLSAAPVGAAGFVVFALILEQILHTVMLPIVSGSVIAYAFYGAFAAGIFEETARFLCFKLVLKKQTSPKTSIMYGLGHGGIEAVLLAGTGMLSMGITALMVNAMGLDAVADMSAAGSAEAAEAVCAQIEAAAQMSFGMCMVSVAERILAMTIHVELSVIVFAAARAKDRLWLYPLAILLHAAVDFPAALYQTGVLPLWSVYVFMVVMIALIALLSVKIYKRLRSEQDKSVLC